MVAIDENQYLLATSHDIVLASKEKVTNKYTSNFEATSLCHYTGSLFLVGTRYNLKLWD